jgi:hypothetical protein
MSISECYVKLVLALGQHDADYVDAYYGPRSWRDEVRKEKQSLEEIRSGARAFVEDVEGSDLRAHYLRRQTEALIARTEMLQGNRMTFDEESAALYDAVAPHNSEEHFRAVNAQLERELPGDGTLIDRLEAFRMRFAIPHHKLDDVFAFAIDACRARTQKNIELPAGESFRVEYVTNKAWSGYNWYQGNFRSLIQVNTDLPIFIDRAIDLACHEGYPGHHVYNALMEKHLVRDRGWMEFSVYPLFSPQSLIAEGSANYGIEVAFPMRERVEFEREELFPRAGFDPKDVDRYYRVHQLIDQASYAGNEAARNYLDGAIDEHGAVDWLTRYALMSPERARQRVRFFDKYRSYVINYNLGKDLVRQYVERRAGSDAARRWTIFKELLSSPRLPSGLKELS